MQIVSKMPKQEDVIVVTDAEVEEFQRIGRILAKVADSLLGLEDTKVSVEADGFMRIIKEDSVETSEILSSSPHYFIEDINALQALGQDDEDFDDEDDDVEEEEDEDRYGLGYSSETEYEYSPAKSFKQGVEVVALKDITVADIYKSSGGLHPEGAKVVVPAGTLGVVLKYGVTDNNSVAFKTFNKVENPGRFWNTSNDLFYSNDWLEIREDGCECAGCRHLHMITVDETFPE